MQVASNIDKPFKVIRVTGFEPMASCSQNRHATKLRYTLQDVSQKEVSFRAPIDSGSTSNRGQVPILMVSGSHKIAYAIDA
jgi:hypothetical protein